MDKLCCTPKSCEFKGEGDCVIGCCKSDIKIEKTVTSKSKPNESDSVQSSLMCCCCYIFKREGYKNSKEKAKI